jgi:hypothetical protein
MQNLMSWKSNIIRKGWIWWIYRSVFLLLVSTCILDEFAVSDFIGVFVYAGLATVILAEIVQVISGRAEAAKRDWRQQISNTQAVSAFMGLFLFMAYLVSRVNLNKGETYYTQLKFNDFTLFFLLAAATSAILLVVYLIQDQISKVKQQKNQNSDHP